MPKEIGLDTPSLSPEVSAKNPIDARGGLLIGKEFRGEAGAMERKRLLHKYAEQLRLLEHNPLQKQVWHQLYMYGDIKKVRDVFLQALDETQTNLEEGGSANRVDVLLALHRPADSYEEPLGDFMKLRDQNENVPSLQEVDANYEDRQAKLTQNFQDLQQVVEVLDKIVQAEP